LAKQIRSANLIGAGFFLLSLPSFFWLGLQAPKLISFLAVALLGYASPLVLNGRGLHRIARAMPLLAGSAVIAVVSAALGLQSFVHLCLFLMAVLPFVVFDIRDMWMLVLLETVPCVMLFVLQFSPLARAPFLLLSAGALLPLGSLATFSAFVPTALLLGYFYFDNQRNEDELLETVESLHGEIEERHRVEAQLVAALRAAEEGARVKAEFVAVVSHELRTPLNGVMGMTSLLRGTSLDGEQREMVENIDASGHFLLALINDILDLSKLEVAKLKLERVAFVPEQLFEDTVRALSPLAANKGLDLALRFAGPAPAGAFGDPARLRQVLTNYLGNALKFTETGFVQIDVAFATGDEQNRLLLRCEVADSGIGIPLADRVSIFEPFTQLDASLARKQGGTGLGLAIAKRLVEQMHGTLGVRERQGGGSVFWFEVPLEADPRVALVPVRLPAMTVGFRSQSPVFAPVVRAWMEEAGAKVVDADGASPANVDVLLVDAFGLPAEEVSRLVDPQRAAKLPVVLLGRLALETAGVVALPRAVSRRGLAAALARAGRPMVASPAGVTSPATGGAPVQRKLGHPVHVLLVEDNVVNQKVALGMFKRLGATAEVAENGRVAIELWAARPFDVILMDLQMPVMDGLTAAREIRQREKDGGHVSIVAVTANATPDDRGAAHAAGMDGFLAKPFNLDELLRILEAPPGGSVSEGRDASASGTASGATSSRAESPRDGSFSG